MQYGSETNRSNNFDYLIIRKAGDAVTTQTVSVEEAVTVANPLAASEDNAIVGVLEETALAQASAAPLIFLLSITDNLLISCLSGPRHTADIF